LTKRGFWLPFPALQKQYLIMPNTKSAERRMRSTARRQQQNQSTKNRVKTLEKKYRAAVTQGDKAEASSALRDLTSALDKSTKTGVLHPNTVRRKKSRLSAKLTPLGG
jgi:small subunit ribosomal protein S20